MKAVSLALLRISTGLLLVLWGLIRVFGGAGPRLSTKYYGGLLQGELVQLGIGWAEIALGALVVLGLFRRVTLWAQAAVLIFGALAIWKYLLDPLGLYLLDAESRQVLFFPSLAMAAVSLVLIAFRSQDSIALDRVFKL